MDYNASASKYLTRTYGPEKGALMLQTDMIGDIDRKIILSICKLSTSYKAHNDNKVKTIQLNVHPIHDNKPPPTLRRPTKPVVCICKAIKMNGDKCTAKVKEGAFCARHSKK
jgi:Zn-dependent M28 family amino/carboxypeptidase